MKYNDVFHISAMYFHFRYKMLYYVNIFTTQDVYLSECIDSFFEY